MEFEVLRQAPDVIGEKLLREWLGKRRVLRVGAVSSGGYGRFVVESFQEVAAELRNPGDGNVIWQCFAAGKVLRC